MKTIYICLCAVYLCLTNPVRTLFLTNYCERGMPLTHANGVQYDCGLSPFSEACPAGYYCASAADDAYSVCCPHNPCKTGVPKQDSSGHELHCGRGGHACPSGYHCNIAPNDAYALCCQN